MCHSEITLYYTILLGLLDVWCCIREGQKTYEFRWRHRWRRWRWRRIACPIGRWKSPWCSLENLTLAFRILTFEVYWGRKFSNCSIQIKSLIVSSQTVLRILQALNFLTHSFCNDLLDLMVLSQMVIKEKFEVCFRNLPTLQNMVIRRTIFSKWKDIRFRRGLIFQNKHFLAHWGKIELRNKWEVCKF